MTLSPSAPGNGIVFRRGDLGGAEVPALYDQVSETRLGTVIGGGEVRVGVIEHLMAAIAGAEIDDLVVSLDGPEPPILNGDALSYLEILAAGVREMQGARIAVRVLRRVQVGKAEATAALVPAEKLSFDFEIAFESAAIGSQRMEWEFSPEGFRSDIAPARTFGFMHEFEALNKAGLALGASLENTLALVGDKVVNGDLMRFPDEFVRHKVLDALGDLSLAGGPVLGCFEGRRSGHALNNALLRALFGDPANFEMVTLG